ncbi:hypothetical protein GE118_00790 [Mycoplasma sp. NEAQ87857]|uniref:thermonuclease family protein n=1 Tax=Mycoplasma sp. NEAQ87857 TaxID=2683967 RepID=UPI001316F946|nr:thermonuclease family protein [Mycoplasma sp. NEAQ87857]QGZ97338.1 hypothetical protein GE118_00790 [Mycoplasma sp. NEAQ87857]
MKKIYKSLLLASTTIATISTSLAAVACGSKDQKNNPGTQNPGTETPAKPINSQPSAEVVTIDDPTLKELKIGTYSYQDGNKRVSSNFIDMKDDQRNLIVDSIKKWAINKYWTNNELTDQVSDYLITNKRKLKQDIPNETQIKVLDKVLTLKFTDLDKSLPQIIKGGEYGDRSKDHKIQESALTLESLNLKYKISFGIYYNNQILYLKRGRKITLDSDYKTTTSAIKPTFKVFNNDLMPNKEQMKPINVDWTKVQYVDAKLVDVSDGDTFSFVPIENKTAAEISFKTTDQARKIRLSGIDTPEKAVGSGNKATLSNPFEYSFALMSTHFAERLFKIKDLFKWTETSENEKAFPIVRIGFITGKDTYERVTADVFFGQNFEYSYNTEIVRAGYTLPLQNSSWEVNQNIPFTYENLIYPKIKEALNEAIEKHSGFFHYFDNPIYISTYVYDAKPNNNYSAFWQPMDK